MRFYDGLDFGAIATAHNRDYRDVMLSAIFKNELVTAFATLQGESHAAEFVAF